MKYREFGSTGLQVSEIAFGGASISGEGGGYGFGDICEQEAIDLLKCSYEQGINIYDTAPVYGYRLSEQRIGKAFKGLTDNIIIVTKGGVTWKDNKRIYLDNEPAVIEKMLHQSLQDLDREYIDLYLVHYPDPKVDIRRVMEILSKNKREGKIKFIGLCNTNLENYKKACEVESIEVLQSEFNLFASYPKENLFELVKRDNLGFMSWGSLDKGILTGRVNRERKKYDSSDFRSWAPWWKGESFEFKLNVLDTIKKHFAATGHSLLDFALGYLLNYKEVSTAICGFRNKDQLSTIIQALDHVPNQNLIQEYTDIPKLYS
ncbi:MAG: hypothetical protein DKM50_10860 [Candidatus Margulisiibacteriota bacterium]|nr:MAG: hypothetical protein A2X43_07670 [Candidatus Margulisbacteria bacterium GWD2_39_127]OGI03899.1 MAG: hypothetical protein A2X42_10065 [Candidatus Margulisbacteria bacterium GWF2_38_17]OGI08796.1 MAG: hypothetical protein A2X41_05050 [Candidatus Margulisbacteria bacterium GWE2_39_32]PZM78627.1 MAG: hypothetical protein DKM50_10860 [Candidatus Margulisiibacteriota bacterium]HAR61968.1 hypothetical protein [Candidatus Margulisiibacteriota bacterium]